MSKRKNSFYIEGLLEPQSSAALIVAFAYRLAEYGRLSGKSPSKLLEPMGIALPPHVIDCCDFLALEQFADIPAKRVKVKKDFLEQQKIPTKKRGNNAK